MKRRNGPVRPNQMRSRNRRKENPEELAERNPYSRNRAGLYDQKQSPAIKKSPHRPQRLAEINILPASPRHHGGQFTITKRSHDREKPSNQPGPNQKRRRINLPSNLRRHNKNAGPNHRPHDQRSSARQPKSLN